MECMENHDGPCKGPVTEGRSRSGATVSSRCEKGWTAYDKRMDKVEAGLQERYPGYNNPHSSPPAWFDPANAGETW